MVEQILTYGRVMRPSLGVTIMPATPAMRAQGKQGEGVRGGVEGSLPSLGVTIMPATPAMRAQGKQGEGVRGGWGGGRRVIG